MWVCSSEVFSWKTTSHKFQIVCYLMDSKTIRNNVFKCKMFLLFALKLRFCIIFATAYSPTCELKSQIPRFLQMWEKVIKMEKSHVYTFWLCFVHHFVKNSFKTNFSTVFYLAFMGCGLPWKYLYKSMFLVSLCNSILIAQES